MRLRYAPAPIALLHIGQARIGLANWLLAKRHGATFLLRLDDADPARTRPELADGIEQDLRWLGIAWDDLVRQSERLDRYAAAAERLKAAGRLYPCFESEEELQAKRVQRQRRNQPAIYDRAMLKLTPAQRATAEAGGKTPYWRFQLAPSPAEWHDTVLGPQQIKLSAISDPVLIRADGTYLYNLTAAVDDLELGITHIVRNEDQLTNTGIQLDIMAALGARPGVNPGAIRFAHLPALQDGTNVKPAKRAGALTLRGLRADGIEPATLAGYLARLGTPDDPAPATPGALAPTFDLARFARTPPRFDPVQLLALNRRALQTTPFEAAQNRLPPAATPAFWSAVRGSLDLMREARGWWDVVAGSIVPPLVENEAEYLHQALDLLPPEPWNDKTWPDWTKTLRQATGRKGKTLLQPLRLALTGEDQGPELGDLLPLMGRARVAERLKLAAT